MSKKPAALRVSIEFQGQFATVAFMALSAKGDLYWGPTIEWARDEGIDELFRRTWHKDGNQFQRLLGPPQFQTRDVAPVDLAGIRDLGASSVMPGFVRFQDDPPEADTAVKKTLTVDVAQTYPEGFTISYFAYEPGSDDMFQQKISNYAESLRVLGSLVADWCTPNFGLIAYTMWPHQWNALDQSIQDQKGAK